jgi:hypothetical protein
MTRSTASARKLEEIVMSVNRIVSFAAAVVISAIQVTALSLSHAQSVRAAAAVSIADDASDGALPVVVVTAHKALSRDC